MNRFLAFTLAVVATVGFAATAWSQAGQAGGAGDAGGTADAGANTFGSAGANTAGTAGASTAETAGAAGTAGVSGTAGASGAAGVPGTAGAPGGAGAAGRAGTGGTAGVGATGAGGIAPSGVRNSSVGAIGVDPANVGQNRLNNGGQFEFNGINQTPFFTDPGVRRQLGLNDNQFNTLNRSYNSAYGRYRAGLDGLNPTLTDQQREQQIMLLQNQFNSDFGRSLDTTFNNPQFRSRYDELNRQYMGFNSFNDPAIQRQLNLSPQQQLQVRRLAADWRKQMQQATRGNGTDAIATSISPEQWSQMHSQYWDQLNSVFTPQQRQTWSQLTGQRYNFPPNAYFPPDNSGPRGIVNPNPAPGFDRDFGNSKGRIVPFGGAGQGTQNQPGTSGNSGQATPQGNNANAGTGSRSVR